ncbi:MAG: hypothetical protein WDZ40_04020 [Candidatus Spechtbacterales bacterium]
MPEKPKFERENNDWESIAGLYKEKKELGREVFNHLRDGFYGIVEKYNDIITESAVQRYIPNEGANKDRLKEALSELEKVSEKFIDEYKEKLEEINNRIQPLEEAIGVEKLEEDRDMHILRVEVQYLADDMPFRPIKEWYQPTIKYIKEFLD